MIRRAALVAAALAASACATGAGPQRAADDPAVQQLLAMPVADYFATTAIAEQVARGCARYVFDAEFESELNAQRNAVGRGSQVAIMQRVAITLETDVRQRSFLAKHALTGFDADLCGAADAETLQGSPVAALLVQQ